MVNYSPFVHKYRPQKFVDLIGQKHVKNLLQSSVKENSIAPAYLFCGPHGVGKTSAARIFAKLINCVSPIEMEPCCKCDNCRQISNGNSMDVIEIDAASNRRIDEVRQLRENVKFSPVACKYKVYIIDEVHMLTLEAFNALLKTLEEPPEYVKFILATTHPHKLPPTILSRCQKVEFVKVPKPEIRRYIEFILSEEGLELEGEIIDFVVESARGCMRDAAALLEQLVVVSKSSDISWQDLLSIFTYKDFNLVKDLIFAVVKEDLVSIITLISRLLDEGFDINSFLLDVEEIFRASLLASESVPEQLWHVDDDKKEIVISLEKSLSRGEIFYMLQILIKMRSWLRSGVLDRLALELGFIKMARRRYFKSIMELTESPNKGLKRTTESGLQVRNSEHRACKPNKGHGLSGAVNSVVDNNTVTRTSINGNELMSLWRKVIAELIKEKNMLLAHILQDVSGIKRSGDLLELVFNQKFSYESIKDEKNISILKGVVKKIFGRDLRFKFSVQPSEHNVKEIDLVLEERLKMVLDTFGGKVVEKGKIKR